jgi:hypothetical protein
MPQATAPAPNAAGPIILAFRAIWESRVRPGARARRSIRSLHAARVRRDRTKVTFDRPALRRCLTAR